MWRNSSEVGWLWQAWCGTAEARRKQPEYQAAIFRVARDGRVGNVRP
jgi:hypothetical protein